MVLNKRFMNVRIISKWDVVHLNFSSQFLYYFCDHTNPFIHFRLVFVACEIFTCEIEVILKTLVDDDELKGLLSSFMGPNHPHSPFLVGYFSKLRKLLKVYHGYGHKF
ncbi:hypothetical protein MKW92_028599 [Papaver armeniacum]|nr:hypothetical protein MKW92_028599 [Papaver armeniacum]